MTAPNVIRTNANGTALVTEFGQWETDVRYISADAPELVAQARGHLHDIIALPKGASLEVAQKWAAQAYAALADWQALK